MTSSINQNGKIMPRKIFKQQAIQSPRNQDQRHHEGAQTDTSTHIATLPLLRNFAKLRIPHPESFQ